MGGSRLGDVGVVDIEKMVR